MSSQITVQSLYIHPFKSASPIRVKESLLDEFGLQYDRIYMLVEQIPNKPGLSRPMSQKKYPKMAKLQQSLRPGDTAAKAHEIEILEQEWNNTINIPLEPILQGLKTIEVEIPQYPYPLTVHDMGDSYADFFSAFMDRECRMVYRSPSRKMYGCQPELDWTSTIKSKIPFVEPQFRTTLTDASPIHIATIESLKELSRLHGGGGGEGEEEEEIDMQRFRPNIVFHGTDEAWDEETWKEIEVEGAGRIAVTARCPRCVVPDVNLRTGQPDSQDKISGTLNKYRKSDPSPMLGSKSCFGMWSVHLQQGTVLREGAAVTVLKRGYHEFKWP